ncbi:MAG: fibrobacter succinogenes major paralogous domain-containing protein [Bacteroidetes bacterium]|nr:fibrobacter succinogenes major paralogous domain-containing protein [Bacteroidota bacterium]
MKTRITILNCALPFMAVMLLLLASCSDKDHLIYPDSTSGVVSDKDGNSYSTVKIGRQVWMAENLRTTKYNDGTFIQHIPANSVWGKLTTPGYCWYNNDSVVNKYTYGALYNWYAVETGKLAPYGWHIPTDAEWDTLASTLGGELIAGGKLKEKGTLHWQSPNTGATNETGFFALPGGIRFTNGTFFNLGNVGIWGSATESDTASAWCRFMSCSSGSMNSSPSGKSTGFSVRCIRDN